MLFFRHLIAITLQALYLLVIIIPLAQAAPIAPFQEENFLVVGVGLGAHSFPDNIEIYQYQGGYLVPLGALAATLDLAIEVAPPKGTASGWFRSEDRTFRLEAATHTAFVNGRKVTFDPQQLLMQPDDIYIDATLFAKWFGVTLDLDFPNLQLNVASQEKLPIELQLERKKQRKRGSTPSDAESAHYPVVTPTYQPYTPPFTDILLESAYRSLKGARSLSSHYSILSQGELAWMGSSLFVNGNSDDGIANMRASVGRQNVAPTSPLQPTQWSAGDIYAVTTPLVTTRSSGRGAMFSNVSLTRANSFNSTNFVGDAPTGWQIELYQNGALLDFQTVGADGRYQFLNIPVFYGYNIFRIVSYGPQGQIEEETRPVIVDGSTLKAKELFYQFSIDDKSQNLFGISHSQQRQGHPDGIRSVATLEYGIADGMSGMVGFASTPVAEDDYDYVMAGLKLAMGGVLFTTDSAYMTQTGGWATQFAATTLIHDISIRADYTLLSEFFSEQEKWEGAFKDHNARLIVNGRLQPAFLPVGLSYTFAGQQEAFESGRTHTTLGNQLTTSFAGFVLSHTLEAEWRDDPLATTAVESYSQEGRISLRHFAGGWFLRLNAEYASEPVQQWESFTLSTQTYFTRRLSGIAEIRQNLTPVEEVIGAVSMSRDFEDYRLTGRLQADEEGEIEIGVSLGFSFGYKGLSDEWFMDSLPLASQGAVEARAFLDMNANSRWDAEEIALPDTEFAFRSKPLEHRKSSSFLPHAEPYRPIPITVKEESIEEPLWVPKEKGYNVITRPGEITTVDVPIVPTSEIDGTLYSRLPDGSTQAAGGIVVTLLDESNMPIITSRSARDGFYLLEKIPPGLYTVRIDPASLEAQGFQPVPDRQMIISTESQAYSYMDVELLPEPTAEDITAN